MPQEITLTQDDLVAAIGLWLNRYRPDAKWTELTGRFTWDVRTNRVSTTAVLTDEPAPKAIVLPIPSEHGVYRWPDGCAIWPAHNAPGKFLAQWADRTPLRGCSETTGMEERSFFASPMEAAIALAAGGEGPGASPKADSIPKQ